MTCPELLLVGVVGRKELTGYESFLVNASSDDKQCADVERSSEILLLEFTLPLSKSPDTCSSSCCLTSSILSFFLLLLFIPMYSPATVMRTIAIKAQDNPIIMFVLLLSVLVSSSFIKVVSILLILVPINVVDDADWTDGMDDGIDEVS